MRDWKSIVRERLGPLPVDPARFMDVVDELAQHVADHHAELVASGLSDEQALAEALRPLADPSRVAAEIARADRPRPPGPPPPPAHAASGLLRDVRYAVRVLLRSRGFAAAAVITLALGTGANTAIFSVIDAVLLQPLPYRDPGRLVMVGPQDGDGSAGNVGYATFVDWSARSRAFEDLALIRSWSATLATGGEPERIAGMRVSANYFRLLGIRPALGRDFAPEEDRPDRWRLVLLSDRLWRRRFGADPRAVGRVITMNDREYTIIGVLPPSFEPLISEHFYQRAEMWSLVGYAVTDRSACRTCEHLKALGRLRAGISLRDARADIDAVHQQLRREHPSEYPPGTVALVPLERELTGHLRAGLTALLAAVAFLLLMACANVANLMVARMAERQRDLALRTALGASRARIVRQVLVESAAIALAGGAAGAALAAWTVPLLTHLTPAAMARLDRARVDGDALAFTLVVSLLAALLFGCLPAFRAARIDVQAGLRGDTRRTAAGPRSATRRLLIAFDVALAVVLLAAAGLMIKSVNRLLGVDPGFNPDGVLTMQTSLVGRAYADDRVVVATVDEMLARLRRLPGVAAAAAAGQIPLGGNGDRWGFHVEGRPATPQDPSVERYSVTPEYFSVMHIPLRAGRLFTDADRAGAEPAMLVGEETARRLWPGADPIGARVKIGGTDGPWRTIIGIVGDVRHRELALPPTMQMYVPQAQSADSFLVLVIRAAGDPSALAGAARQAIWSVAREAPVYAVAPLADLVSKSVGPRRFVMLLLGMFGAVAVLMTSVGIYGVVSYSVTERTREIGIRSALGATRADIVRLMLGGGLAVVGLGLAAGTVAALATTRLLESSLYGVHPNDPGTYAAVAAMLLLVAVAAHAVPVVRATRVDPSAALKNDA